MSLGPETGICLLNDSFPPVIDGVANAVLNYAEKIEADLGHAIVATPAYPGADDSAYPFPVVRFPSLDTQGLVGYRAGLPFSLQLAAKLETDKVELLHSHCPVASTILARKVRESLDIPLVFTYHTKFDIDIARAIQWEFLQEEAINALVQNISACDEVWAVSKGAADNLRSLGFEGDVLVMENGVDLPRGRVPHQRVMQVTSGFDLPGDVPVYLFVGRLMWYKGLSIILDALALVKARGLDFRMVFIGAGGDEDQVRAYVDSLGLAGNVLFVGALQDREMLRGWYCRADLFLFPSTFDTNGLVVREAAACSLASVLVKGSCAAEGVCKDENGFLIEESAGSLAALLEDLHGRPGVTRTIGEAAARDLYLSWSDAVSRAWERYHVVIDRYRSGEFKRERGLLDTLLALSGSIMEALGKADVMRRTLEGDGTRHWLRTEDIRGC